MFGFPGAAFVSPSLVMGGWGAEAQLGPCSSMEVRVDDLAALGRMADNFEDARAAADAAAAGWLEVEAENERLKLLLALALMGWASSSGGL